MAVFTPVSKSALLDFLKEYNIGKLISYSEIIEGIENTNYKINTEKGNYILTLFEKRVNPKDLPFFMNLQKHLAKNNFFCPVPIENKQNNIINSLCGKETIIISFLQGNQIKFPNSKHCLKVGKMIAEFKQITKNFSGTRKNGLGLETWKLIFLKCLNSKNNEYREIIDNIKKELIYLENKWPLNLPTGIIHADIFQDNVFFENDEISGLIDFYFSCNDFYLYDLAITTNAWCFNEKNNFDYNKFNNLLKGYESYIKINDIEKQNFNTLLRGASIRILLTRLHDKIFHPSDAIVVQKNPFEYLNILKWHQKNYIF